jgi:hypothetical protein
MDEYHIDSIYYKGDILIIVINDQQYYWSLKDISDRLYKATESQRNNYVISPAGYGIHWPEIDEDLSLKGLLKSQNSIL